MISQWLSYRAHAQLPSWVGLGTQMLKQKWGGKERCQAAPGVAQFIIKKYKRTNVYTHHYLMKKEWLASKTCPYWLHGPLGWQVVPLSPWHPSKLQLHCSSGPLNCQHWLSLDCQTVSWSVGNGSPRTIPESTHLTACQPSTYCECMHLCCLYCLYIFNNCATLVAAWHLSFH